MPRFPVPDLPPLGMISIVIPTVTGREDHYERCRAAYVQVAAYDYELLTETDHATCGLAWQAGAMRAAGDYIHFTCDDLEPLPGWDDAAVRASQAGAVPAPKVTHAETGELQSWPAWGCEHADGIDAGFSAIPFLSRTMWEVVQPLFTGHYYCDNFISYRARKQGWPSLFVNGYAFRHHWAQHRRGAGMTQDDRLAYDRGQYDRAVAMADAGEWREPWP
jgi:hypothetical protein